MKPQDIFEHAKNIAFKKQVTINEIYEPLLVKHGYQDAKGKALKSFTIMTSYDENLNAIPKKQK
jgi:hypothetical protein|tara:strand:+ start:562 stop:753 length:192 start_codon:yes stop_codon:yes gene_type:complete